MGKVPVAATGCDAMPLTITDDLLRDAGVTAPEARVEIACRLFEAQRLTLPLASRWAGVTRTQLEHELLQRDIPLFRPTPKDLEDDLRTLARLGT